MANLMRHGDVWGIPPHLLVRGKENEPKEKVYDGNHGSLMREHNDKFAM
jgi:hypothetical protein